MDLVLATGAAGGGINSFRSAADGRLTHVTPTGLRDGVAISGPLLIETVTTDTAAYVFVGAAGTGSVTVFTMQADGSLVPSDQFNDDLTTRFQGVSVLEAIALDGRVCVLAGGADYGVTLMALPPNGRLLHRDTFVDGLDTAMTNPGGLTLQIRAGGIDVFVAGQGTSLGVAQLRIEPGDAGEVRIAVSRLCWPTRRTFAPPPKSGRWCFSS